MSDYFTQNHSVIKYVNSDNWVILNQTELSIREKIEQVGTKLADWDISINRGILTGYNDAFIIDDTIKNALIASDPKSAELIRPILRGKDIKRYTYSFANLWLIYIPWHFPLHKDSSIKGSSMIAEKEFELQYPAIYNYLNTHKDRLSNRNKSETGIRYEWYALQRWGSNYSDDFNKRKIMYPCIMAKNSNFILDTEGIYYTIAPGNIITGANLEYLLLMLNSKIFYFAMRKFYMGGGIEGELKTNRLLKLPVPLYSELENNTSLSPYILLLSQSHVFNSNELYEIETIISQILNLNSKEFSYIMDYKF